VSGLGERKFFLHILLINSIDWRTLEPAVNYGSASVRVPALDPDLRPEQIKKNPCCATVPRVNIFFLSKT